MKKMVNNQKPTKPYFSILLILLLAMSIVPLSAAKEGPLIYAEDKSLQFVYAGGLGRKLMIGTSNTLFNVSHSVYIGSNDDIYVADTGNKRVQVFAKDKSYKRTLQSGLERPVGVAADPVGDIYVADEANGLFIFNKLGNLLNKITTIGDKKIKPIAVDIDNNGKIYVASENQVFIITQEGTLLNTLGRECIDCTDNGEFYSVSEVKVEKQGTKIYVADSSRDAGRQNYRIQIFDRYLNHVQTIGGLMPTSEREGLHPWGMTLDSEGLLYVADPVDKKIKVFDANGNYIRRIGNPNSKSNGYLGFVTDVAVNPAGTKLYTVSTDLHLVQIFSKNRIAVNVIYTPPTPPAENASVSVVMPVEEACVGCRYGDQCLEVGLRIKDGDVEKYCTLNKELEKTKSVKESCTNNYECASNICKDSACKSACDGCTFNDYCLFMGARIDTPSGPSYCDLSRTVTLQKVGGEVCQNSYECLANQCLNNKCYIELGFFKRLWLSIKSLFS